MSRHPPLQLGGLVGDLQSQFLARRSCSGPQSRSHRDHIGAGRPRFATTRSPTALRSHRPDPERRSGAGWCWPVRQRCIGSGRFCTPVREPRFRRRAGLSLMLRSPAHRQQQQAGACRLIANDRVEAVGRGDVGLALAKDQQQRPGRPLGRPLLSRASSGHELEALGRALIVARGVSI